MEKANKRLGPTSAEILDTLSLPIDGNGSGESPSEGKKVLEYSSSPLSRVVHVYR